MMMLVVLVVTALVVLAGLAYWYRQSRETLNLAPPTDATNAKRTRYQQDGVPRQYQRKMPKPGDLHPLSTVLARAVDPAVPMPTSGESVPFDQSEVSGVVEQVVHRVNSRTPGVDLTTVSFDNVRKSVDQYKMLRYEADVTLYSKARAMATKVALAADVTSKGELFVRTLKPHGAAVDDGQVAAANTGPGPGGSAGYADFEPALRY